ncbi:hypothetical protein RRG08_000483 [Elysia crispata]|uniref:Uncharacterized protein n=1 Tax=Elysia crispata TaxID=231223 RepID=A0AAE0YDR2_9GAST|nr:hypothetical protein RRG08_000483 [Elysia crispata]
MAAPCCWDNSNPHHLFTREIHRDVNISSGFGAAYGTVPWIFPGSSLDLVLVLAPCRAGKCRVRIILQLAMGQKYRCKEPWTGRFDQPGNFILHIMNRRPLDRTSGLPHIGISG